MKISWTSYTLELRHPFTISGFSRTHTPLLLVTLELDGKTGYGEASMVPYLGESIVTSTAFLQKTDLSMFRYPFCFPDIIAYLDQVAPGNPAIKAALDIALHDLQGKLEQHPCYTYFGSDPLRMPETSVTIGMDTPDKIRQKVREATGAKIIKVKVGGVQDEELIRVIRSETPAPLYADANQGWKDRYLAIDKIGWLQEQGVVLVEQPLAKTDLEGNAWVTARSTLPIIGDEAVQRLADVDRAAGVYHGINVKLMKSAGMFEAHQMIERARALGLSVLIGCMSETSIATLAAAALAPLCDWADLDGPFLTRNNPFKDPGFSGGKWVLTEDAGLGLKGRKAKR